MRKYFALALFFAVPASATSLVFSPDAARVMKTAVATPSTPSTPQSPSSPSTPAATPGGTQQAWQPAPLRDGGYAMCNNPTGCHAFSSNAIIANYGTVWMYAWNGRTASTSAYPMGQQIGAFWPQGQYQQPGVGTEGLVDEWQGVA